MAPRGSTRKLGTSRMDAAIDAMIPFGFPKELVRAKMNDLLKEYGGDVGYPFIEAEAYKVLIDAILAGEEEESKQRARSSKICAEGESLMKDDSLEDERVGDHAALATSRPSGGSIESIGFQTPNTAIQSHGTGNGNSWKDIDLDQTCSQDIRIVEAADSTFVGNMHLHNPPVYSPLPLIASSPALQSSPTRRRRPCYGWISDGEEDDINFVILTPAVTPSPSAHMEFFL